MDKNTVDKAGQAAVNAAIAELGKEAQAVAIVVVVRPIHAGNAMNVTSNLAGEGNHTAIAAVLGQGKVAVERGAARTIARVERRLIVPS